MCKASHSPEQAGPCHLGLCHERPGRKNRPPDFRFAGPAPLWSENPTTLLSDSLTIRGLVLRIENLGDDFFVRVVRDIAPDDKVRLVLGNEMPCTFELPMRRPTGMASGHDFNFVIAATFQFD